ncbi:MAG: glycosyltransferase family 4 protein [Saprospiraceae bacterium]|jgi:glycosyltransferase involved in cell wall biosynthesis
MYATTPPFRIALVQNQLWAARRFRHGLMRVLRKEGFQVSIIAPFDETDGPLRQALEAEGFEVLCWHRPRHTPRVLDGLFMLYGLWQFYRAKRFRLCLHYTALPIFFGALAAGVARTPCIAVVTGLGVLSRCRRGFRGWLLRCAYRLAASLSREHWFLNESDRQYCVSHCLGRFSNTFVSDGEGVDVDYFRPYPPRSPDGVLRLLYVGRLLRSKGLEDIRDAARYFRKQGGAVEIRILGIPVEEHPDRIPLQEVYAWAEEGLVRYLGYTEDIRPFLAQADALLLPSHGEGMSRAILEACSMGLPVITTDVAGCRELVVEGENGFLCPPRDVAGLVAAIERLQALNTVGRTRLGRVGRERVCARYSDGRVLRVMVSRLSAYRALALSLAFSSQDV